MTISNPKKAMQDSLESSCVFDLYRKTLQKDTNIATDGAYQKNFTSYYRVRRDAEWLKAYYCFFEKIRIIRISPLRKSYDTFPASHILLKQQKRTQTAKQKRSSHLLPVRC